MSAALDADARAVLRLDQPLRVRGLADSYRGYLPCHRERVFHAHSVARRVEEPRP